MHHSFIRFLYFFLCITTVLNGRFALENETDYTLEKYEQTITVKKDGSYEVLTEMVTLLKTEYGRDAHSKMTLTYRDGTEKIEVLSAKTIIGEKEYSVDEKHMEDKQLASSSNGFADKRQIIIAFPKAEVGARLYTKIKFTSNLIITKGHFYDFITPLNEAWSTRNKITIYSEIPLYCKVNDPGNILDVKTNSADEAESFTQAVITQKKPGTENVVNDLFGILSPKKSTWVSVSSLKKWDDIGKDLFPKYNDILSQKMPALYEEIISQAKCEKNEIDQINKVMSLFAEKVQYLGSWMTFSGMFIPRDLKDVESTRFGDCKDFSTGTVAMLRALGLHADVVFVQRGEGTFECTEDALPSFSFNHAMVKAIGRDGKIYWLDPTNFTSSTFVYPDIADRSVLVPVQNDPCKATLEKISQVEPFKQQKTDTLKLMPDDRLQHDVSIYISETSRFSQMLTGIHLRTPPSIVEDQVFSMVSGQTIKDEDRLKKGIPTLKDRSIKPVELNLSFIAEDLLKSNIGFAYIIPAHLGLFRMIDMIKDTDVLDWDIDLPGEYSSKYVIKDKHIKNLDRIKKSVETPWFNIQREADHVDGDTVITQKVNVLKRYIPNDALKSETFKDAQREIIRNFKKFVVAFEKN